MSEEPEDARGVEMRVPPAGPEDGPDPSFGPAVIPRVVVKADLLPSVSVLSLVALLGLPMGWLWSRLAPPQETELSSTGKLSPVLLEGDHQFDALGVFLLLGLAAGVLTGSVLWLLRTRRGPVVLLAGVLGSLLAGWLAIQTGVSFAAGLYPVPAKPRVGDLIEVAPEIATWWVMLAQPLALSLVYGVAASWNGLDDLGRRRK